ncbi:MAG: universal stress protein UspA [Gammaproteobacteria bacterium (ex Lamellibrachia satsuma)]|nr:MAG: universal stress protein [Gammaproteobacteria bacterium (ex Lamellibrachia satsuma)]RRS34582.1 MAG: universal stress protein UspA [Gammaproteobacteria bacterium (ex Lamellibrachia satsuma)]RRS37427.1 MAG: universal stress protein UspA [Gammaproteobacteria bacterium (ex Lamellibrachia satsuma)]
MSAQTQASSSAPVALPTYDSILLAVDSSDHSNRSITEAVNLAAIWNSALTAAHVYAAKLHDVRFRQMEGGLPEQFREEEELERQRDVHDDLITRGLSIITDSYMDQVEKETSQQNIELKRRALEGKNYRELARETNSGNYDLLVMGALGLGAVKGSRLGTVCQRVARRCDVDMLVIKDPQKSIKKGPIVVAVDGSTRSYGGLLTALALSKEWDVPLKVISAFDPYYHYVAFNRIAGVLSEEAGKVFRFQEQEKLHEEIIDSGLAKIYQGHLEVAQNIAADQGMPMEIKLLDGKPHDVINRYLKLEQPSLLVIGKLGIHADDELDIGGNAEALLYDVDCAVLLSQREYRPPVERIAEVTTSWTNEAEVRMERVPSFVRNMARMAILRYAQEHGHTVITESIVEEATAQLMPGHAEQAMSEIVEAYDNGELKRKPPTEEVMRWDDQAKQLLLTVDDLSLRGNLSMRAEKKARGEGHRIVVADHIRPFIEDLDEGRGPRAKGQGKERSAPPSALGPDSSALIHWQAAALARLMRVPEGFMRDASKQRIEAYASDQGLNEISLQTAEAGLAKARDAMASAMQGDAQPSTPATEKKSACPFAELVQPVPKPKPAVPETKLVWSNDAEAMLANVPAGYCRDMTIKAAETIAGQSDIKQIDAGFLGQVMQTFTQGSATVEETMPWNEDARERIAKAPEMVQGMLVKEIEGWTRRQGLDRVDHDAVDAVKQEWAERGVFHLDPNDHRNG